MTRLYKLVTATASCILVGLSGGCAQDADAPADHGPASAEITKSPEGVTTRPTLTAPELQPPSQQSEYTDQGRPEVAFDPCTWIDDDAVVRAGLDPASRRRGQDLITEYTFFTCDFDGLHWDLQVDSGNASWQEDLDKNGAINEPLTINGREAMWVRDPHLVKTCDIHVRTKAGFVIFNTTRTFEGSEAGLERCDGVLHIAETFEPSIGADN
ncbi:DUF3558 domain-containing protein [Nocardia jinanensis]|uniref:DUF3558 domain-containing protein n=1 Tax=Nocardia jinanensis TaxID=382504 RepID=A0A917VVZ3_9NOCA|nr:DUF3558 domain-containing protein [Nocardia jinanensis]GGL30373.1 hypothetical protein GCM10011588_51430 [Nocardia jinanensis]